MVRVVRVVEVVQVRVVRGGDGGEGGCVVGVVQHVFCMLDIDHTC